MLPALIISKVVPKVLDMVLKRFKGIDKIDKLVDYMEKDNDADRGVKKLMDITDKLIVENIELNHRLEKLES